MLPRDQIVDERHSARDLRSIFPEIAPKPSLASLETVQTEFLTEPRS
jgi:hypothetical protein